MRPTKPSRTAELLAEARRAAKPGRIGEATARLATRQIDHAARGLRDRCDVSGLVRAARTLSRAEQQGASLATISSAQRDLDELATGFTDICIKPRARSRPL